MDDYSTTRNRWPSWEYCPLVCHLPFQVSMCSAKMFMAIALLSVFVSATSVAERLGTLDQQSDSWTKVENGLIVSWQVNSRDATADQIEVFEMKGRRLASLKVLAMVPEAKSVSVYDVSARPGQLIAVSAVYAKEDGSWPAGALLYFSFSGKLLSAFALAPSRGILRLAIDEKLHVWTLTTSSGEKQPADVPMIVEYDASGRVVRELLKRDAFPLHSGMTQEGPDIGTVAFGYDAGALWFWLPGTTDLVTIRTADASISRMKTDVPRQNAQTVLQRVFRKTSGEIVAVVAEKNETGLEVAYYTWAPASANWTRLNRPACEDATLIGLSSDAYTFIGRESGGVSEICSSVLSTP